jgi:hypothetical protein
VKALGSVMLGAACIALLLAPSAQAHKLTPKAARAALKPLAEETASLAAPKIAAQLPGATISETRIGRCRITSNGHRAVCIISFLITGVSAGETVCSVPARVQFRSKRSKALDTSLTSLPLVCAFTVPLE